MAQDEGQASQPPPQQVAQPSAETRESRWDRAYQEVERAREAHDHPDLSIFTELTKSAGGSK